MIERALFTVAIPVYSWLNYPPLHRSGKDEVLTSWPGLTVGAVRRAGGESGQAAVSPGTGHDYRADGAVGVQRCRFTAVR